MDALSLGHLLASLERRIEALEADWRKVKRWGRKAQHYGKRTLLVLGLYLGNMLAHADTQQIAGWIKWALGPMVGLLGQIFS